MGSLVERQTSISGNVLMLCRFLRDKGFQISPSNERDALKALSFLKMNDQDEFKAALRTTLTNNHYQYNRFADLYDEFWYDLARGVDSKVKHEAELADKPSESQRKQAQFESLKDWLNLNESEEIEETATYSDLEVLTTKDFNDLSQEEMELMMRILQKAARRIAHQRSRLKTKTRRKRSMDLKRTIRENMRHGGDISRLVYSKPKDKKLKLVVLCDVSKSMDLYSRFFVHLIYAFQNSYDKIETFVFSTALHRLTDVLDNLAFKKAFQQIAERVSHWSGGTTIGACFQQFVREYGYQMLDRKTLVIILSDGWDRGGELRMKDSMRQIHKLSRKVIWLNPLAGSPGFSPEAVGMKAAWPYIDTFSSAHNLESMKKVLVQLSRRR